MKVQLIRIVKPKSQPHQGHKKLDTITQTDAIRNFEIFYRDLKNPSSNFKVLINPEIIADRGHINQDVLIPVS